VDRSGNRVDARADAQPVGELYCGPFRQCHFSVDNAMSVRLARAKIGIASSCEFDSSQHLKQFVDGQGRDAFPRAFGNVVSQHFNGVREGKHRPIVSARLRAVRH